MPGNDSPPRGRFKFHTKGKENDAIVKHGSLSDRTHVKRRRKSLSKDRIYLGTPSENLSKFYHSNNGYPDEGDLYYERGDTYMKSLSVPLENRDGRKIVYRNMFRSSNNERHANRSRQERARKGMVIGERPSIWKNATPRRPLLPNNLFLDNLRDVDVDWRRYNKITWNDILESHQRDMDNRFDYTQTLPQKEAWLASIDNRVKYSRMNSDRELPSISPRLFNSRTLPPKPPVQARYLTRDKLGNMTYIVGPTDVSGKEYRPYVLPELVKTPAKPKKIDF